MGARPPMQTTVQGVRMVCDDEGAGVPLLFVHGFPLSRGAWEPQRAAFRTAYRVLTPDLRGFGESEATPGPVTMDRFAEDLHALCEKLETGPVVLAGHSMGGYVALAFARRFPGMLRGLVLVGTRAGTDTPEAAAGRRATAERVMREGPDGVCDAMAPKMLAPGNGDPVMRDAVRRLMAGAKAEGMAGALLGMAARPDATPQLAGIRVPTLVVTGTEDVLIVPAESERMAAAIPGARLALIPDAGHLVAFERPEAFNRVLGEWLAAGMPVGKPI